MDRTERWWHERTVPGGGAPIPTPPAGSAGATPRRPSSTGSGSATAVTGWRSPRPATATPRRSRTVCGTAGSTTRRCRPFGFAARRWRPDGWGHFPPTPRRSRPNSVRADGSDRRRPVASGAGRRRGDGRSRGVGPAGRVEGRSFPALGGGLRADRRRPERAVGIGILSRIVAGAVPPGRATWVGHLEAGEGMWTRSRRSGRRPRPEGRSSTRGSDPDSGRQPRHRAVAPGGRSSSNPGSPRPWTRRDHRFD